MILEIHLIKKVIKWHHQRASIILHRPAIRLLTIIQVSTQPL